MLKFGERKGERDKEEPLKESTGSEVYRYGSSGTWTYARESKAGEYFWPCPPSLGIWQFLIFRIRDRQRKLHSSRCTVEICFS
jgi:hypothetical protein